MRPFDVSALPELVQPSLASAVDEGLMLAEYSSRISLKNSIEIGVLTGDDAYAAEDYAAMAQTVLEALAEESAVAAEHVARQRKWAVYMEGKPQHVHDYHPVDGANLRRREELSLAMAERLRERRDDAEYVAGLVERARGDAWHEIARAIEESLDRSNLPRDANYERERDQRMRLLVTEDLARLRDSAPRASGK
jgi:hypothetical protein